MKQPSAWLIPLAGFFVLLLTRDSAGRTWHVKNDLTGDWETIAIAIDNSVSGDTILVGPGAYYENLVLDGKELVLKSEMGAETTTLDGSLYPESVILLRGGLTNATVIEGFTITGGRGSDPFSNGSHGGGGIECLNAAPIIRKNIITKNRAEDIPPNPSRSGSRGGAISFGGSVATILIENNEISDNFAFANGGGINIEGQCLIRNNLITRNSTGHGDGAGLYYLTGPGPIVIENNHIVRNVAADHGGAIYTVTNVNSGISPSEIQIIGNLIVGNEAYDPVAGDGAGGGLWLFGGAYVYRNTIAFNHAESRLTPVVGGVCILYPRVGSVLENNIIQGNSEGGVVALVGSGSWLVSFRHNVVHGNGTLDVYNPTALLFDSANTYQDAHFCTEGPESGGDVASNSPALTSSYGRIGAVEIPGCGPVVPALPTTWGRIKNLFNK